MSDPRPDGSLARGLSPAQLASGIRAGDRRALSRLMTVAERDPRAAGAVLSELRDRLGRSHLVGVTGPPGGGKSTLLLRLAEACLAQDRSVGIVAVDPTSPISGGSVLGDRIRLQELHSDLRVFIRSMASGGVGGGLAARTLDMADLLDAFGFQMIFIESVGVGQGETDISRVVDTNVVVVVPGLGDEVQALKAGVLETGDILVVNKADRPEARALQATLRGMLELGPKGAWETPVIATSALKGDGVDDLVHMLDEHRRWLISSGEGDRRRTHRLVERARLVAMQRIQSAMAAELSIERTREAIRSADGSESAVEVILDEVWDRLRSERET